jgi:glycosyltransferase involved in cell wall biosynthesis
MSVIRICQMITELRPAGAERCVYELATRLEKSRFDVRVVALRSGSVADDLRAAGIRVDTLDVRGRCDVAKLVRLVSLLSGPRIDILHTHLFHADLVGKPAAAAAGVPHVVNTIHVAEARHRPWQFAWARLSSAYCRKMICVSQAVADFHRARTGLARDKYEVIPNGIATESFFPDADARIAARRELGLGGGDFAVAFAGRLDPQKGLAVLLEAARLLADQRDVHVLLAGQGPLEAFAREFIKRHCLSRVRLLGFVRPVQNLYNAADVLAMPSRWEGFGLSAAEAMSCGLAVVSTKVAGLAEVVGDAGMLVPPDDPRALAKALIHLRDDEQLRKELASRGRARVASCYQIQANVGAHQRLYERIIESSGGSRRQR